MPDFFELYRRFYEAYLGQSITTWLRFDCQENSLVWAFLVALMGIWIEVPRSFKWGATGLFTLAYLLAHVFTRG
ncbi:MAG: hypothetical protein Q7J84_04000 [Sulfuricaulis sp.]|nr:hypothetical protein [Sulfuricaulis sp.]